MEPYTVSSRILTLHRAFAAYTSQRLQELGLNFGQMYFILYVGKHPDCTPSELTKELHLDWGHSQRSLVKLVEDGFLTREKLGRSYRLRLTSQGEQAFMVCHRVFADWDAAAEEPHSFCAHHLRPVGRGDPCKIPRTRRGRLRHDHRRGCPGGQKQV